MGNGTVLTVPQAFELNAAISQQIPRDISGDDAQYWAIHKEELGAGLRKLLIRQTAPVTIFSGKAPADLGKLDFWVEMWNHLDWEFNASGLFVPAPGNGFNWFIAMPKGMTPNSAFEICEKRFSSSRYTDDLDQAVTHNDRDARNGAYIIRVRDRIEADKEFANWSVNKLQKRKINCNTLAERLVLEIAYFLTSGKHLDNENWTLCAGSRNSVGRVPCVYWSTDERKLRVYWCSPDNADGDLRARQAVS